MSNLGRKALKGTTVYAIGHSTMPIARFIRILDAHSIGFLVDIRTIPRSRHNPQFGQNELSASLGSAGIGYLHMKDLGGLRHPGKDSENTGWRNEGFRGYADYMQTEDFATAIKELSARSQREESGHHVRRREPVQMP